MSELVTSAVVAALTDASSESLDVFDFTCSIEAIVGSKHFSMLRPTWFVEESEDRIVSTSDFFSNYASG